MSRAPRAWREVQEYKAEDFLEGGFFGGECKCNPNPWSACPTHPCAHNYFAANIIAANLPLGPIHQVFARTTFWDIVLNQFQVEKPYGYCLFADAEGLRQSFEVESILLDLSLYPFARHE